jgi:hypothetical protein
MPRRPHRLAPVTFALTAFLLLSVMDSISGCDLFGGGPSVTPTPTLDSCVCGPVDGLISGELFSGDLMLRSSKLA